ncbi:MAG: N-6 DNA methylase, partial [Firmicutes bacterium]|nr:N-6 DNA methylase [Bacillota bacterium]
DTSILHQYLGEKKQVIQLGKERYCKCHKELERVYQTWTAKAKGTINDLICTSGAYKIFVPNTCRYFTTASSRKLARGGVTELVFDNIDAYSYVYCLINSSFAYWYWRMFDGGITYSKGLLCSVPIFFDLLDSTQKEWLQNMCNEMRQLEEACIVTKNNVGVQENIKFPKKFRTQINAQLLRVLGVGDESRDIFDFVHSNHLFGGVSEHK